MKRILALFLFSGCTAPETYVQADRATYEQIAPAHRRYIEQDLTLNASQRASRLDTLNSWELRIRKAEGR